MSVAPDPKPVEPVQPPPEPTLIEQAGAIPDTVVPVEPVEPEPEAPALEVMPEPEVVEDKPKAKKPWFIDQIAENKRRAALAEQQVAELKARLAVEEAAKAKSETPTPTSLTREQYERDVKAEALRQVQAERYQARSQTWLNNGVKEYGMEAFNERCDLLAAMGASDKPDFMEVILDPDIIPDGHKVVAQLAEKPEEAQRILAMPSPVQRAAALVKFSMTIPAEKKQISNAPKPISPIGGTAKQSAPSETDDIKTWVAKRNAEIAARKQR